MCKRVRVAIDSFDPYYPVPARKNRQQQKLVKFVHILEVFFCFSLLICQTSFESLATNFRVRRNGHISVAASKFDSRQTQKDNRIDTRIDVEVTRYKRSQMNSQHLPSACLKFSSHFPHLLERKSHHQSQFQITNDLYQIPALSLSVSFSLFHTWT